MFQCTNIFLSAQIYFQCKNIFFSAPICFSAEICFAAHKYISSVQIYFLVHKYKFQCANNFPGTRHWPKYGQKTQGIYRIDCP